jgi:hypothetical protein
MIDEQRIAAIIAEALNSNWAKQTPNRAKRVAGQIRTGEYYPVP